MSTGGKERVLRAGSLQLLWLPSRLRRCRGPSTGFWPALLACILVHHELSCLSNALA